ncbi:unnamed protein product [Ceutorhynchus assimilis]|uniref:Uncharacterized protein n=1 Tax=Ceutorhynchus assimilis TaxID=467358 RepID=A0A9N9ML38_9CUCU|nr:unnamed protein product [Ceutorhynchus assimilis]
MEFKVPLFLCFTSLLCASRGAAIIERQEIDESTNNSTESSTTVAATTTVQSTDTVEIELWPLCDFPLWPIEIWEDPVSIEDIDPEPEYVELLPLDPIVWPEFEPVFYP